VTSGPSGSGPSVQGPFSPEVLEELRTVGGAGLVRELMEIFAERTPERLRSVEDSIAAGDLPAAAAALHSLRSASGTVGARDLADLAGRLERAARGHNVAELTTGLGELQRLAEEALREASRTE
jgi:protein-histidine pros-kinase